MSFAYSALTQKCGQNAVPKCGPILRSEKAVKAEEEAADDEDHEEMAKVMEVVALLLWWSKSGAMVQADKMLQVQMLYDS